MLGLGCRGGEGGEGRGGKKAEAYPIREGKYWGRGERGGSRNTEVEKERETLMCKVQKGAGTRREREQEHWGLGGAGQAGAQGCREETGTLRLGGKAETLGWYGAVGEVKQDHKTVGGGGGGVGAVERLG